MKRPAVLVLLSLLLLAPCRPGAAQGELVVYAASSLREAFREIGRGFREQTGQPVRFNFAGSQILCTQIDFGAPADVFAAADPRLITRLLEQGLVEPARDFAANRLVLLIRPESGIRKLSDLARPGVHQLAIGNEAVPVGRYTRQLLEGLAQNMAFGPDLVAAIESRVATRENSVKAIVARVLLNEVDAGIVYRSDLTPAVRADASALELPTQHLPAIRYSIAVTTVSPQPQAANAFIDLLLSPAGQDILQRHGFLPITKGLRE